MPKIISISKAKQKLLELSRMNSVLMSFDEYESIIEKGHFVEWKPTGKKSTKKAA